MSDERNLENEELNEEMYDEEELDTIVLTLEDGGEIECGILGVFEVEGYDSDYIARNYDLQIRRNQRRRS